MKRTSRVLVLLSLASIVCILLAFAFRSNRSSETGLLLSSSDEPVVPDVAVAPVETSVSTVEDAASVPPSPQSARRLVRQARQELERHRAAAAESLLLQAVTLAPANANAWNVLGRAQLALGHVDEAQNSFARACESDTSHAWARNNLGWLHLQHEEWSEALPLLEDAVRLDGDVAVFHNNLGVAYERARRFEDAAREYARAIELQPTHPSAGLALARVCEACPPCLASASRAEADSVVQAADDSR